MYEHIGNTPDQRSGVFFIRDERGVRPGAGGEVLHIGADDELIGHGATMGDPQRERHEVKRVGPRMSALQIGDGRRVRAATDSRHSSHRGRSTAPLTPQHIPPGVY